MRLLIEIPEIELEIEKFENVVNKEKLKIFFQEHSDQIDGKYFVDSQNMDHDWFVYHKNFYLGYFHSNSFKNLKISFSNGIFFMKFNKFKIWYQKHFLYQK